MSICDRSKEWRVAWSPVAHLPSAARKAPLHPAGMVLTPGQRDQAVTGRAESTRESYHRSGMSKRNADWSDRREKGGHEVQVRRKARIQLRTTANCDDSWMLLSYGKGRRGLKWLVAHAGSRDSVYACPRTRRRRQVELLADIDTSAWPHTPRDALRRPAVLRSVLSRL
jgi:hypothetical protein